MLKFTIEMDIKKNYLNKIEIRQLEYLLERTLNEWDSTLALQNGVTEKLVRLWEKGCTVEVQAG